MYHTCSLVFQVTQPMSIDNCSVAYRGQRSLEVKVGQRNGTVQMPDARLGMRLCSSSSESGDGAFWQRACRREGIFCSYLQQTFSHRLGDSEHFNFYARVIEAQKLYERWAVAYGSWIYIHFVCQMNLKACVTRAVEGQGFRPSCADGIGCPSNPLVCQKCVTW